MARSFATAFSTVVIGCVALAVAQEKQADAPQVGPGHEFLKRFAGEWQFEGEAYMEPGQPPVESQGSMTGRMIGDYWTVVDVKVETMGQTFHGQGTFGYDSQKKQHIGTWADSASEFLWRYEGIVEENKLILHSQGPGPSEPVKMIKTRDTWEFTSPDEVIVTGEFEGADGKMMTMMKAICTRKK